MVWACGDYVDDYFGRMVREAKRAGYNSRHASVNLVTQLPQEIMPACKKWISETEGIFLIKIPEPLS